MLPVHGLREAHTFGVGIRFVVRGWPRSEGKELPVLGEIGMGGLNPELGRSGSGPNGFRPFAALFCPWIMCAKGSRMGAEPQVPAVDHVQDESIWERMQNGGNGVRLSATIAGSFARVQLVLFFGLPRPRIAGLGAQGRLV